MLTLQQLGLNVSCTFIPFKLCVQMERELGALDRPR